MLDAHRQLKQREFAICSGNRQGPARRPTAIGNASAAKTGTGGKKDPINGRYSSEPANSFIGPFPMEARAISC